MPRLPNIVAGLLLAIVLCARRAASQASLPNVETALWSNAFVVLVGNMSQNPSLVTALLEKAVRDQYTQQGYGVSIVNVRGCLGTQVINLQGYMPPPASAPGPGPAFIVPEPATPASPQQVVYDNPNGTYTGAPAAMPLQTDGYQDQPNPLAPSTVCYRLNATIFFEPSNSTYLDPALGTSNELNTAITQQARAAGIWAQFYLLNVTLASSAGQVVYTGDQLQHLPETGYLITLAVYGEGVLPAAFPRQVVFLSAFQTLNIYNTTNTVRSHFRNVTQNSAGFNITCLSIVRPDAAELLPQAVTRIIQDGSFLQAVQEAGLPAASLSIVTIREDNSTTLGSQLSAQLTNRPVVTSIGTNIPNAPPQAQSSPPMPLEQHSISPGAVAGIAVGAAAAIALLALAGVYVARRHLASQKLHSNAGSSKSRDSPPPAPQSSPQQSVQSRGHSTWLTGSSPPTRQARSLSASHESGDSFPSSSGARAAGKSVAASTGGSWQLEAGSLEICQRPDGSDWVLGSGSYGIVYKGLRDGVQEVAIKKLSHIDKWQLQQFQKEIDLLRALSYDKNIVQFFGASMDPDNPFLVLEHMGGGDLREVLNNPKQASKLLWQRKGHKIALDIARGLVFLHKRRIIHADLKSKNILLSEDLGIAKLADVGLSRIMQGSQASSSGMIGTFSHAAPEMILGYKVNEKVDIFSFGVILWEIIMWDPPIRGQLHTIDTPRQCPTEIAALITHCMHRSPKKRPSAKEVYKIIQASASGDSSSDADEPTSLTPFHISSPENDRRFSGALTIQASECA